MAISYRNDEYSSSHRGLGSAAFLRWYSNEGFEVHYRKAHRFRMYGQRRRRSEEQHGEVCSAVGMPLTAKFYLMGTVRRTQSFGFEKFMVTRNHQGKISAVSDFFHYYCIEHNDSRRF